MRALPPVQKTTAAYLQVTNEGPAALTITGATSNVSEAAEIHESSLVDGMMRMAPMGDVALSAGSMLAFTPGGNHLMLLGLARMPMPGESVELCLTFAERDPLCTEAPVRKGGTDGGHHHH